ncbi:hypothetical protein [Mesorhizobium sp. WSM4982]|uniref:hypothetical protein n=1 Tax=Mesorhizobium sp. WSM4982 TaxID=3038550 RepID=UPI002414ED44|nr:hypothetical protein [Mesorhizobium sp. WSM4982]MDG4856435.1 hypothetical protein [Mesorhizobium sp. WSM4982]
MKDITGADLKIGDLIAWGAGGRRTPGVAIGIITDIGSKTVTTRSLTSGRLGKTLHGYPEEIRAVLIHDQLWPGNR